MKNPPLSSTPLTDGSSVCRRLHPSAWLWEGGSWCCLAWEGVTIVTAQLGLNSGLGSAPALGLRAPLCPTLVQVCQYTVGMLAQGHSPFEDKVEPVSNYSHPDEPDAHCFIEVEPDGEEDKKSIPEISSIRDEEEPVLGALEVLLQPVCCPDAQVVQEVHVGLHPPLLPLPSAWLWLSPTSLCHWGFILGRVLFAGGRSLSQH